MKGGMVKTRRRVGVGDKDDRLELHRLVLAERFQRAILISSTLSAKDTR